MTHTHLLCAQLQPRQCVRRATRAAASCEERLGGRVNLPEAAGPVEHRCGLIGEHLPRSRTGVAAVGVQG